MKRIITLIGLSFLSACSAPAADAEPEFDACLITNMAAVSLLEEGIEKTEEFLTRADMTQDAYESVQASLATERASIANLLSLRANMLRDETLDDSEQAARNAVLMRNYAKGAEAAIAAAKADEILATELAAQATACAPVATRAGGNFGDR